MPDPKFLEAVAAGTIEGFIKHSMSDDEAEAMLAQVGTIKRQRADQKAFVGQSVADLLEALGDDEHDDENDDSVIGKLFEGLDRHYALEAARLRNPEDEESASKILLLSKLLSPPSTPLRSPASSAVAAVLVAEDGEELEVADARDSRLVVEMQADAPVCFHPDTSCAIRCILRGAPYRGRSALQAGSGPLRVPLPFPAAVVRAAVALLGDDPLDAEKMDPRELRG